MEPPLGNLFVMPTTLKSFLRDRIAKAAKRYIDDLEAMPEEMLGRSPGGVARTPYDFTYEIVYVNRRLTKRLKGEDPGPANMETWLTAPPDFQSKDEAKNQMRESSDALLSAFDAVGENALERVIPLPQGETSPLDLAALTLTHYSYHDAQLNYIQAMSGDDKVHWSQDE